MVYVSSPPEVSTSILNRPHPRFITATEARRDCTTADSMEVGTPFCDTRSGPMVKRAASAGAKAGKSVP